MFFSSGKHVIKNFIYENWNFESFDQFPQKKMEWNKLYSNLATKYVYLDLCAHLKTIIRDHRSPMML